MTRKTNPFLTIDTDAHCGTPLDLFERYLDPEIAKDPDAPRIVEEAGLKVFRCGRYMFPRVGTRRPGDPVPKLTPSGSLPGPRGSWDAAYRVRTCQDFEGIDRSILMPFGVMFPSYVGKKELGNALAVAWNDWLHDFCKTHPTRLFGYGLINIADPAYAVKEMRRCVLELGFPSVNINTSAVGETPDDYHILSDEYFYPIWEEAERLGVPVSIHAFPDPHVPGLEYNWPRRPVRIFDSVGFPTASMFLFANLVLGGICETFPKLKVGLFECTIGWLPQLIHGINSQRETFGEHFTTHAPKMRLRPEEYIQRQIYFSVEVDDPFIRHVVEWTGAPNRLMYSSDYPHLEYHPGQVNELLARDDLDEKEKRMILGENALGYYRWEDTAAPQVLPEEPRAAA
jgi:predicted TIM-barrel fold metal-dependent hydrolase